MSPCQLGRAGSQRGLRCWVLQHLRLRARRWQAPPEQHMLPEPAWPHLRLQRHTPTDACCPAAAAARLAVPVDGRQRLHGSGSGQTAPASSRKVHWAIHTTHSACSTCPCSRARLPRACAPFPQADMDDEDEEKATAAAVAEALTLQKLLVGAEEDLEEAELDDLAAMAMEGVDADAVDVDVEDVVAGTGADRFIEAPLTPMESAMVAPMKLSKGELRSLVPQVRKEEGGAAQAVEGRAQRAQGRNELCVVAHASCRWGIRRWQGSGFHVGRLQRPLLSHLLSPACMTQPRLGTTPPADPCTRARVCLAGLGPDQH